MRDKILDYITYIVLLFFAFLAFFLLYLLFDRNTDKFITLVQVVVWPGVILVGFLFFRKLFAYLFLSIEEFNFFGVRGKLRSVTEVIEEKAGKLLEQRMREDEMRKREENLRFQMDKLKLLPDAEEFEEMFSELFEDYKEISEEYQDSLRREEELKAQLDEQSKTIATLQEVISKTNE